MDGRASTNLLEEIEELPNAELDLRIYGRTNKHSENSFLFTQFWPEQYISEGDILFVDYALQAVGRYFKFDQTVNTLLITPNEDTTVSLDRFPLPQAVTIEDNDQIEVIISKLLYTSDGWKTVTITTLYKRYTTNT
ncbi:hypothetical protein ACFSKU_06380 [Pontibacter silvestris]|uniref:Peptidase S24/S26A/S26B/S26C domain-containing protein n=1 Tax=Pontibacter silvestris TaxID=2305183 RepID=A0ABW4WXA6_9BACT|nr:hypothetical protein [Pontibacter silvestris]MCC9136461.1 hypothetical protein [Pontibacter silvestris]